MWNDLTLRARRFAAGDDGSMTVHGLFMFTTACIIAAIGLDTTHVFEARSQLQTTADSAAHAALYTRHQPGATAGSARAKALALVSAQMPASTYGSVASEANVEFGTYDPTTRRFTPTDVSRLAARVTLGRRDTSDNPVDTFLFRLIGIDDMDVVTQAVFTTYGPPCLSQGFVAGGVVDMQSNNDYYRGFCIHSNSHVEINSNNWFELGTTVSMPDTSDLTMPSSGWASNDGIAEALKEGEYDLRILERIAAGSTQSLFTSITTQGSEDYPDYITNPTPVSYTVSSNSQTFDPSRLTSGRIYNITCSGNRDLSLAGGTYSGIVINTNCPVKMSGRVRLEDAILMTTNTSATSITTPTGSSQNGLEIGRPDNCAPGWGAQIITRGGFRSSAALILNGGQILALGNVDFAANAEGRGASIITGARIDSTSNMSMSACATGMEDNFEATYFRLAG